MADYKGKLMGLLEEAVSELYDGALVAGVVTDNGFYCDFEMEEAFNPERVAAIGKWLAGREVSCAYELSSFSGAYRDGDSSNVVLQRMYVAAFESEAELQAYRDERLRVAEHDHKRIGMELGLFSTSEDVGAGLVLWHPKGAIIRYLLEQFSQGAHILNDYQWVYTPHIGRSRLWQVSGHLDNYQGSMFRPMDIDGEEYYLKPMSCPFHFIIYNSETRSYRDLPMRMAEFGTVYRYELSGTLHGLTRVRGFTQDDAHIVCTPEQVEDEVAFALQFSLYILRAFGLSDFKLYVSTRPQEKAIGSVDDWDEATRILMKTVVAAGLDYEVDEGGGAFYGPKIDLKLFDSLGREWQCGTIQFDFNLPERFQMKYVGRDGKNHAPFIIHRALFGSMERFAALLIEHYKGDFPLWFAPTQFALVPIKQSHNEYGKRLEVHLKEMALRMEADYEDVHMREKIKRFEKQKVPYILVFGDRDVAKNGFSVRSRKHGDLGWMDFPTLMEHVKEDLDQGKPRYIRG